MRKLLMTVLTLALILGSISVASAASGKVKLTDIADNANEEAIQVSYDLGIVLGTPEGTYEPDKAVNRAEFAALVVRALAIPDSALSSYSTTTFKDTSGYGWAVPYLAILQQKGIMKGDGYGNAMPGRTISPNEAVTMVLRAIGYTDNASVLVGQWPANYVSLGQSLNLYEQVSNDLQINKASAAQMIYNALTAQLVQVDANSTVKLLYDSDNVGRQTLLTTGLNCYEDPGAGQRRVVTYTDAKTSKINLIPKVGAYGILYRSRVDDEVVALTEVETEFLAGRITFRINASNQVVADKFQSVDGTRYNLSDSAQNWANHLNVSGTYNTSIDPQGNTVYTLVAGTEVTVDSINTTGQALFLNGDSVPSITGSQSNKYLYRSPARSNVAARLIVAAKVSGVTILELRSIAIWDTEFKGDNFLYEAGQIDGKKFNGHDFPLDVNNDVDDYGYVLAGVDSLDDIAADNVIYIYKNGDNKIARIDVGTATQSGAITNINEADATRTIGGKVLTDSPYHHLPTWNDLTTINNEGTALLDIYGRTYAFQLSEASKGNFAVVTDFAPVPLGGNQVKLFDKTGKDVVYSLKDDVHYNDPIGTVTSGTVLSNLNTVLVGAPGSDGILIEYKLSGGKLGEIRTGTFVVNGDRKQGHVNKTGTILTVPAGNFLLDSSTLVYTENAGDYSLASVNDLVDKDITHDFWYILGASDPSRVKALVVDADDAGAQNLYVLVNSVTRGTDNAGGEIDVVTGVSFADGVQAASITKDYTDATLRGIGTGRYAVPAKFRIGEDGILKAYTPLSADSLYRDSTTTRVTNPTITGAGIILRTPGSGGTFTLTLTGGQWEGTNTLADLTTVTPWSNLVAFEANTVLYKVEAGKWVAMAPSDGNFNADEGRGVYAFFKTDAKKAYDIIIKIR